MKSIDCRNLKMNIARSFETSGTTITKTHRNIPDELKNMAVKKTQNSQSVNKQHTSHEWEK